MYYLGLYNDGKLEEEINKSLEWRGGYVARSFIKPEPSKERVVINIDLNCYVQMHTLESFLKKMYSGNQLGPLN